MVGHIRQLSSATLSYSFTSTGPTTFFFILRRYAYAYICIMYCVRRLRFDVFFNMGFPEVVIRDQKNSIIFPQSVNQ